MKIRPKLITNVPLARDEKSIVNDHIPLLLQYLRNQWTIRNDQTPNRRNGHLTTPPSNSRRPLKRAHSRSPVAGDSPSPHRRARFHRIGSRYDSGDDLMEDELLPQTAPARTRFQLNDVERNDSRQEQHPSSAAASLAPPSNRNNNETPRRRPRA